MAEPSSSLLWAIVLLVSVFSFASGVIAVIATTHTFAYVAAPNEVATFIDTVDYSIQENENYDCDIAKVPRLEDKLRLGRLLREIQKQGDDLREHLNRLVVEDGGTTLRTSARVFWANHRKQLEERVRRLDMLRMRFLVVFMGVITTAAGERAKDAARTAPRHSEKAIPPAPPPPPPPPPLPLPSDLAPAPAPTPLPVTPAPRPGITKAFTDGHHKKPRRLMTHTIGHSEKTENMQRSGWFGVVAELQRSPILRQRHASIEAAMRSPPPMSPIGSPLSALRPMKGAPIPETLQL
ncbi:hypothetical protein F4678DRAFT_385055 [Xylaria arbuscula]|nr:hypothetical protein F4678DRAFT_385055 [Xylaria arbuscula]